MRVLGLSIEIGSLSSENRTGTSNSNPAVTTSPVSGRVLNRLAEIAREYLKKGSKVYVEGSLKTRKWSDRNGGDHYTTEIMGKQMQIIDSHKAAADDDAMANEDIPF